MTIPQLLDHALETWHATQPDLTPLGRTYTPTDQSHREAALDRCIATLQTEVRQLPRTPAERRDAHARITAAFVEFARSAMEMDAAQLALLLDGGFSAVGTQLGRQARRFDSSVSTGAILQACRNAWAACGLQSLLGRKMQVTPAIFAYSMLYPYSDNYLDDPAITPPSKLRFSGRFRQRLAGELIAPESPLESTIWGLIAHIETQYPRAAHCDIYESLLAIHAAQEDSIRLLRGPRIAPLADIPRLIFAKGGSSVLTDAYLAAGTLSDAEALFAFEWGVLLQLGDDLQDVREDCASGLATLFSRSAGNAPLDTLTAQTIAFAGRVLARLDTFTRGHAPLRNMLRSSSLSLLVRAAGAARHLHTPGFINQLERYSPFRFSFLESRGRRLDESRRFTGRFFEAFLEAAEDEPVFPLFPGALLPR